MTQQKGEWAHSQVKEELIKKGFKLLFEKLRPPREFQGAGEVDLIFEDPKKQLWLLEVKARTHEKFVNSDYFLSPQQRKRLLASRVYIKSIYPKSIVRFALAWVKVPKGEIVFLENP